MRGAGRLLVSIATLAAVSVFAGRAGEAHKPITSPYTFNEDVFPIVRARCAGCHAPGGIAPMSLLTHADAVPWGESIRAELMAGHMPPWGVDTAPGRFRNVSGLTARELNVLLTWASGGTPQGDPAKAPPPIAAERGWPLGAPDLVVPLPEAILAADVQEHVAEFTVPTGLTTAAWIRAVDLLPGNAAIVRSAAVSVQLSDGATRGTAVRHEELLTLWVPGDHPVPLDTGAAWHVPAGAVITARVRYRKTWEYEREVMTDRSRIGLYFAEAPATALRAIDLSAASAGAAIPQTVRALAVYAEGASGAAAVTVTASRPDGSREELIAFRPRGEWARRYWFREPIAIPRGTRIEVNVRGEEGLLPPGAFPPATPPDAPAARLTLNVVPVE